MDTTRNRLDLPGTEVPMTALFAVALLLALVGTLLSALWIASL